MLGPGLGVRGGISALEGPLLDHFSSQRFELRHRATMTDRFLLSRITHFVLRIISLPLWAIRRPALVHIHLSHGMSTVRKTILALALRVLRIRYIIHSHSSEYQGFYPKVPRLFRWFVDRGLKGAAGFIVLSESWAEFYQKVVGIQAQKMIVLNTPVPEISEWASSTDEPPLNEKEKVVYFSGRIGKRKGAFDLIEAWSKIPDSVLKDWRLILTGDGDIKRARTMIDQHNLGSVELLGWVSEQELVELYRTSAIYVLPSYNEGQPMGLIHAMSYGCASISTSVGGIPEVIEHEENGLIIEPGDGAALINALTLLMGDEETREQIARGAILTAKKNSLSEYIVRLEEFYASIINSSE